MSDPHNNQDKPAAENSTQCSSFVDKMSAFISDPKPSGSTPSTWVPVREQAKHEISRGVAQVKGLFRKK